MKPADLPVPKLPGLFSASTTISGVEDLAAKVPQRPATPPPAPTPQKTRTMRKDSLEFPEADPWGSPTIHKGNNHEAIPPKTNGTRATSNGIHEPVRTTSSFTTASQEANGNSNQPSEDPPSAPVSGVWGSYDGNTSTAFNNSTDSTIGGSGFGSSGAGGDGPAPNAPSRSFGGGRVTSAVVEENVIITLLPEKEGMFMFQHHNYQVTSPRRGSKVVRRYSDFVWLLDCLQKRYPVRQLPLLPPKRVGGK
jgi:sorting nexin-8